MLCLRVLCVVLFAALANSEETLHLDKNVQLEVINHLQCDPPADRSWAILIGNKVDGQQFEEYKRDSLTCYKTPIQVTSQLRNIMIHAEMSHTTGNKYEYDHCQGYNPDTKCDGFGSCLYCDVCAGSAAIAAKNGMNLWMEYGGDEVSCSEGLTRAYNDYLVTGLGSGPTNGGLFLHMCLPSREEFLAARGITKDLYDQLIGDIKSGTAPRQVGAFITLRFISLSQSGEAQQALPEYRDLIETNELYELTNDGQQMSSDSVAASDFFKMLKTDRKVIGCHKIIGNILIDPDE